MTYVDAFYIAALNAFVARYAGKTLRIYDAVKNGLNVPAGVMLSEIVIPNPSHGAAAWNATANLYEALKSGSWVDNVADAGGTPRSFVIGTVSGGVMTVEASGTAGGPTASPAPELLLSADALSAGAPFSITEFTQDMARA